MKREDIKSIRQSHGWTQSQMAAALGVSREHYNRLENGAHPVSRQTAKLAQMLARQEETGLQSTDG